MPRADLNSTALAFDAHEAQGNSAREREPLRIRLNEDPLDLIERHFLCPPRAGVVRHLRSLLKRPAVLEVGVDHRIGVRLGQGIAGELSVS